MGEVFNGIQEGLTSTFFNLLNAWPSIILVCILGAVVYGTIYIAGYFIKESALKIIKKDSSKNDTIGIINYEGKHKRDDS